MEYKSETVDEGGKAVWPWKSDYTEPQKPGGYAFVGWEYNGVIYNPKDYTLQTSPFGPINEKNVYIKAKFSEITLHADSSTYLIDWQGGADNRVTLSYWVEKPNGDKITDDVKVVSVGPATGTQEIYFEQVAPPSVIGNKNVWVLQPDSNTSYEEKTYRFKGEYSPGGLVSEIKTIRQAAKDTIVLPDFDHITFTYSWGESDGIDLDSATFVMGTNIPISSLDNRTLDNFFVGYGSGVNNEAEINQYIQHGGDNVYSGDEGAYINFKNICNRELLPQGIKTISIEIYANWYEKKGNANMGITFKTYKGDDALVKNGHIFEPAPGSSTVIVSEEHLPISGKTLTCYASGQPNIININSYNNTDVKNYYSKVAVLTYDIESKQAVLKGVYENSGRSISGRVTFTDDDGSLDKTSNRSDFTVKVYSRSTSAQSGTFTLSNFMEIINGQETSYSFNLNSLRCDSYGTAVVASSTDNSVTINWTVEPWHEGRYTLFDMWIKTEDTDGLNYGSKSKKAWEINISVNQKD